MKRLRQLLASLCPSRSIPKHRDQTLLGAAARMRRGFEPLEPRWALTGSMYVGTNLDGIADWGAPAFVNLMNEAREWATRNADGSGEWNSDLSHLMSTDDNGWPTSIPFDPGNGQPLQVPHTILPIRNPGIHTLIVEGTGTLKLEANEGMLVPDTPFGRSLLFNFDGSSQSIDVEIFDTEFGDASGDLFLTIESSDPVDPIRKVDFVIPGHSETYQTQPFDPAYTEDLAPFSTIRFMDWSQTNNNLIESWDQRATPDSYSQAQLVGGSVEYAILLANELQQNAWITIPAHANDDFVRNAAGLVRDQLDPNLKVFIEYSNETWNFIFEQSKYVQDKGEELQLDEDRFAAGNKYTALRSAQVWTIFEEEFGQDSDRILKVLATHAANVSSTNDRIAALNDSSINPGQLMPDALAIAPYFGGTVGFEIENEGIVNTVTVDEILDRAELHLDTNATNWVRNHADIAADIGAWLITYEGGQHLVGSKENDLLTEKLIAANRDERMYDLYASYLDMLRDEGVSLHTNFSYIAEPSEFGSWGILETVGQAAVDAHKYRAIDDWIADNEPSNIAPIVRTQPDIHAVDDGDGIETIRLDAIQSRDLDGVLVSFEWTQEGNTISNAPTVDLDLSVGTYEFQLIATDDQGAFDEDTIIVTVAPQSALATLVDSDFSGTSPSLNTPWLATTELADNVEYAGWKVGQGLSGSEVDDVFGFTGVYGPNLTTLEDAVSNDTYVAVGVAPVDNYLLDLRGAEIEFQVERIGGNSSRRYAIRSSVDGYSETLFDTGTINSFDPIDFRFALPVDAYSTADPVEFRIYAYEGQYANHASSLTDFTLGGASLAQQSIFLTGDETIEEGSNYDLEVSAIVGPSTVVAEWIIDWGDGTPLGNV